jgi:hypothetical protein
VADNPGAFHHAEAPVWAAARVAGASVAEAAAMVAAGIGNRSAITFSITL